MSFAKSRGKNTLLQNNTYTQEEAWRRGCDVGLPGTQSGFSDHGYKPLSIQQISGSCVQSDMSY